MNSERLGILGKSLSALDLNIDLARDYYRGEANHEG